MPSTAIFSSGIFRERIFDTKGERQVHGAKLKSLFRHVFERWLSAAGDK